eukprot:CAMPEP_0185042420 /NCGR_PEP_ID=MMETSP1103-20130426/42341_1 /TAXON_ID=36769 /ORGANISM="Paraphysomonas bandaiensis, Strain Caron Lab Isolate" /LENGTH=128 /DNA_ID=CAMNT_0027582489 /DNA_START=1728 /DNA_END=2114 /DNA_ORIENTATION=-
MIDSLSDFTAKLRLNALVFKDCGILRQPEYAIDSLSEFSVKLRSNALVFKDCGILRQPEYACVFEFLSCHSFSGLESTVDDHVTGRKRNRGEDDCVRCHDNMHDVGTFSGQPKSMVGGAQSNEIYKVG